MDENVRFTIKKMCVCVCVCVWGWKMGDGGGGMGGMGGRGVKGGVKEVEEGEGTALKRGGLFEFCYLFV